MRCLTFRLALATLVSLAVIAAAPTARAQSYHVLYNFTGQADGGYPAGDLVLDAHGNLYGMTSYYGRGSCSFGGDVGCGTAFELARKGSGWILTSCTPSLEEMTERPLPAAWSLDLTAAFTARPCLEAAVIAPSVRVAAR